MDTSINGLLITVRTSRQGAAMEKGKFSEEYIREISTLTINPEDFAFLDFGEEKRGVLKSDTGEIFVTCKAAEGPPGLFFLPLGPPANKLLNQETYGTGVPDFKGIPVQLTSLNS